MLNYQSFPAVHCSPKEVRRLRKADYSYQEIADVLGVSKTQVYRVAKYGHGCRCEACPRARSLEELEALPSIRREPTPRKAPRKGWLEKGLEIAGGLATLYNARQEQATKSEEEKPASSGW